MGMSSGLVRGLRESYYPDLTLTLTLTLSGVGLRGVAVVGAVLQCRLRLQVGMTLGVRNSIRPSIEVSIVGEMALGLVLR